MHIAAFDHSRERLRQITGSGQLCICEGKKRTGECSQEGNVLAEHIACSMFIWGLTER